MPEKKENNKIDKQKLTLIKKTLELAQKSVQDSLNVVDELMGGKPANNVKLNRSSGDFDKIAQDLNVSEEGKIIEGVFNGQNMIGPDERMYPVPANYASKSKLIEGDILKLTIQPDGSFVFKQIGPIERKKIIGKVLADGDDHYILAENKKYKVLLASITYFKAEPGDEVTIIVPEDRESTWASIENVIKKTSGHNEESDNSNDGKIINISDNLEEI